MISNEETEAAPVIKGIFKNFIKLVYKANKYYFWILLLISMLSAFIPAALLYSTELLVNSLVISNPILKYSLYFLVVYVSILTIKEMLQAASQYYQALYQIALSNSINIIIMEKCQKLGLADFEDSDSLDLLRRANDEGSYRPFQIYIQLLSLFQSVISLLSIAAFLMSWKWWVALLLIVLPLGSIIALMKVTKQEYEIIINRTTVTRKSWYLNYLLTNDRVVKEVKLFNIGSYLIDNFRNIYKEFYKKDKFINKRKLSVNLSILMFNMTIIGLTMYVALTDTLAGVILAGSFFSYLQGIVNTTNTSQMIISEYTVLMQDTMYLSQLFQFLNKEPIEKQEIDANIKQISLGELESIKFDNVSFKYPGQSKYVLNKLNLELKKGEIVALVGKNGSGKSTIVKLITRLYLNFEGSILINGIDINRYDIDSLRKKVGVVFQDFVHYELTMRENIGFGNLEQINNNELLRSSIKKADLEPLVDKLPIGVETQLGKWFPEGHQLSGGQWQKIALARAYMKDADFYVMDEPSSALDAESEEEVFNHFRSIMDDKIGLYITHRFSSIKHASYIYYVEEGKILEEGKHSELMDLEGKYMGLYNLQLSAYNK
ncbi:ABC transporter ATP-binding protein [Paenibacillus sp. FSL H8-0317]|uniref:ABC transporter ATP-binding protein n=1 Tax=unclassified Paenibacillus TaxID=185978 RepID=UPI0030D5B7E5